MLSHADLMLHRAERNGRHRVGTFDGVVPSTPFASAPAPPPIRRSDGATPNHGRKPIADNWHDLASWRMARSSSRAARSVAVHGH